MVSTLSSMKRTSGSTSGFQTSTLKMTKGGDIASASPLVIDTDGNYFDVTGTTNFSAMTVEAGNFFMLQFDGALTITHGSGIELPGAANLTTATGDRLICYATAANTVEVMSVETEAPSAAAFEFVETQTASSDATIDFTTIEAGFDYIIVWRDVKGDADFIDASQLQIQVGTGAGPTYHVTGYRNHTSGYRLAAETVSQDVITTGFATANANAFGGAVAGETVSGEVIVYNPGVSDETDARLEIWGDMGTTGVFGRGNGVGRRDTVEVVTALRVEAGTINFATGEFILMRRKVTA